MAFLLTYQKAAQFIAGVKKFIYLLLTIFYNLNMTFINNPCFNACYKLKDIYNRGFIRISALGLFLIFYTGCSVMYVPTMQQVPMFKVQGEVQLTVNPRNCQFAYSITENFGLLVNGFYTKIKPFTIGSRDEAFDFKREIYHFDVGGGFYKKLNRNFSSEIFAGAGWGHSLLTYGDLSSPTKKSGAYSNLYKIYLQPNLVYRKSALSLRIEYVDFYNYLHVNANPSKSIKTFLISPAITFREGNEWVNSVFQFQYSLPMGNFRSHYEYEPFSKLYLLSFGLEFQIDKFFK